MAWLMSPFLGLKLAEAGGEVEGAGEEGERIAEDGRARKRKRKRRVEVVRRMGWVVDGGCMVSCRWVGGCCCACEVCW